MLILSRQCAESIHLGDQIVLTVVSISGDKVRIGVDAPPGVRILRMELDKFSAETKPAADQADESARRRAA